MHTARARSAILSGMGMGMGMGMSKEGIRGFEDGHKERPLVLSLCQRESRWQQRDGIPASHAGVPRLK